ncbi:MAG: hypothetical protein HW416_533 [Chloroflexi bacterium]|nr:hypothetical protein [Chloroflexota bacterium]
MSYRLAYIAEFLFAVHKRSEALFWNAGTSALGATVIGN